MTHDETVQAVRKSLLADEGRESHHGVYAKRRPRLEYEKPLSIDDRESSNPSDFEGCVE